MKKIKITGVSNIAKLEEYVDSNMIDIMYVEESFDDSIILSIENEVKLYDPKDKEWLHGLISQALSKCEENNAKITW